MPATLPVAQILDDPEFRTMPRLLPWYLSPKNAEEIFINPRDDFPPPQMGPARQRMIADAGDDSPALMEIAQILSTGSPQAPTRIDLSSMPGARTRGEVSRIDLSRPQDYEPQTVNREAKRDSLASVETPSMARGITQEALGQAMLMGYGDDIEGWLKGRHPEDIRRERLAFGDENPEVALGANVAGIAAGGLGGRLVKGMIGGARAARELDDELPSRLEVDVRQAMRNASDVEAAAKPIDDLADQLQRLLSNPETRLDIQGKPLELSPSQIFAMTADAQTAAPPEPQADELDMTGLSPIDRLRMNLELGQAAGQNLTEDEKARNAAANREAALGMLPIVGNWMAARDAGNAAGAASAAFSRGDTRAGLMQSALAALSSVGAITGVPGTRMAGPSAAEASRTANIFAGPGARTADQAALRSAKKMAEAGVDRNDIWRETGWFFGPDGKWRFEIDDSAARLDLSRLKPSSDPRMPTSSEGKLGDVLDHPELFEAYPDMRGIDVTHSPSTRIGSAYYQPADSGVPPSVTITGGSKNPLSSMLHEGQHDVQYRERTSAGGSTSAAYPASGKGGAWPIYQDRIRLMTDPIPIEEYVKVAGFDEIDDAAKDSYAHYLKGIDRMKKNGIPPSMDRAAQESAAQEWYMQLIGEVEARNVQARQGMKASERRATPPWETQDTPDWMQIRRDVENAGRQDVFVPVEDARKIDDVLSRRSDDVPLREIYHDTGAFIDPSGKVLREIPDYPMGTGMGRFRPGDQATLGEYADHPVFDLFPQYRDLPVTFTDFTDVRGGAPIARTLPDGGVELSLAPGDPRKGVAKVLQYNIAKDTGLPPSLRHGKAEALEGLQRGPRLMSGVKPGDKADLEALAAYIETMNTKRQDLLRNLELVDPKKASTLVQLLVNKNAGNVNSRVASGRATLDSQGVKQIYPYNKQTPYFKRGGGRGITDYEDMFVLPPEGASDEQLLQFLREWRTYGAGRPPAGG